MTNGREAAGPDPVAVAEVRDASPPGKAAEPEARATEREEMVRDQIEARGIRDPAVLLAMRRAPRHLFVPEGARSAAYDDRPVPIGWGQTISQPYVVALMSELAEVRPGSRVLEIGTGSGYQAAILAEIGARVWSIEIVEPLANRSAALLRQLGLDVTVRHGDGYGGWPEQAPFDAILLTAAPPEIPEPLLKQLAPGGRLIAPVGRILQELVVVTAEPDGFGRREVVPVRFVPMTGRAQSPP